MKVRKLKESHFPHSWQLESDVQRGYHMLINPLRQVYRIPVGNIQTEEAHRYVQNLIDGFRQQAPPLNLNHLNRRNDEN